MLVFRQLQCIYVTNVNKNHKFKKISCEKHEFFYFQRSSHIFTKPVAKIVEFKTSTKKILCFSNESQKSLDFINFRKYNRICMQPISKPNRPFQKICKKKKICNLAINCEKKKVLFFSIRLCNQLPKSFYNFYHVHYILNFIILLNVLIPLPHFFFLHFCAFSFFLLPI